jgi:hypothetical protein
VHGPAGSLNCVENRWSQVQKRGGRRDPLDPGLEARWNERSVGAKFRSEFEGEIRWIHVLKRSGRRDPLDPCSEERWKERSVGFMSRSEVEGEICWSEVKE